MIPNLKNYIFWQASKIHNDYTEGAKYIWCDSIGDSNGT